MIILHRPSGQMLKMEFNQDGALSKAILSTVICDETNNSADVVLSSRLHATLNLDDVTGTLRYVRRDDCVSLLRPMGFMEREDPELTSWYNTIAGWAAPLGLFLFCLQCDAVNPKWVHADFSEALDQGVNPVRVCGAVFSWGMDPVNIHFNYNSTGNVTRSGTIE